MKILIGADGSDPAFRAASFLAEAVPGPHDVTVLVVLSYSLYPYREGPDPIDAELEHEAREEEMKAAEKIVRVLRDAGNHVSVVRRFGFPPDEIAAGVEEAQPDLIVMGRRGVHGMARWLGSVSEHALHHAAVPVLLVP